MFKKQKVGTPYSNRAETKGLKVLPTQISAGLAVVVALPTRRVVEHDVESTEARRYTKNFKKFAAGT